jgi:hypothetical protein
MKPTRSQYVLAYSPAICICLGALLLPIIVGWKLLQAPALLLEISFLIWFVMVILVSLALGAILSGLFVSPLVCTLAGKLNGSPFQVGDLVQILAGKHRDRIGRVYEVWGVRRQLRIELSEQESKGVTDVFDYFQICRVQNSDQVATQNPLRLP